MRVTHFLIVGAVLAGSLAPTLSSAQVVVAYDLESALDGFGPNGLGVTISADTIGATNGPTSLKASLVSGATFVGALTGNVAPSLGDPPGVDSIIFDLTITEPFAGGFASLGVTIFGATQPGPGQVFGIPVQFSAFVPVETLAPGTTTQTLNLSSALHPVTFIAGQSFDQIFGTVGSGPNDVIPTGFQFFINKSAGAPLTLYIDNVRTSKIPEPATATMLFVAAGLACARRLRVFA